MIDVPVAEFNDICRLVCPHCRKGAPLRQRGDTREYVHDIITQRGKAKSFQHSICWANGFRNSAYAPKVGA